ncbi:unnamed protein product [Arctogadus glacialis]
MYVMGGFYYLLILVSGRFDSDFVPMLRWLHIGFQHRVCEAVLWIWPILRMKVEAVGGRRCQDDHCRNDRCLLLTEQNPSKTTDHLYIPTF